MSSLFCIMDLMDVAICCSQLRRFRWPDGQVICPRCSSKTCDQIGTNDRNEHNNKYRCDDCNRHFNDLTGTVFQGSNIALTLWMACLYLMGLNCSNRQISQEIGVSEKTAQRMTTEIRKEVQKKNVDPELSGEVELDEVYVVAGHKGHPDAVKKKGGKVVVDG